MFQEYGALGPLQRQHLTDTHYLCDLAAQVVDNVLTYPGTGDYQMQELNAPLLLLAMLFRRYHPFVMLWCTSCCCCVVMVCVLAYPDMAARI